MRVVHYLNQFFGGIGAEEHAGVPLEARDGPVGPGRLLETLLGDGICIVTTLICGDNHAVENQQAVTASVVEKVGAGPSRSFHVPGSISCAVTVTGFSRAMRNSRERARSPTH